MGNGNSSRSKSKVYGQSSSEPLYASRQGKPSTKAEVVGFPPHEGHGNKGVAFEIGGEYVGGQQGFGVYSEQHGKKSLDNDDTFTEYIQRAKQKIRTVSNIDPEHSNPAPAPAPDAAYDTNNKENQNDQFSEFIQRAKKKMRTTSRIGKNGSFKRG